MASVNTRLDAMSLAQQRQECLLQRVLQVLGGGVASVAGGESAAQSGAESAGGGEVPFAPDEEPRSAAGGDEEPQNAAGGDDEELVSSDGEEPQNAAGGDDPPAGDFAPAGVDESRRVSPTCLGVMVAASRAREALLAAGEQLEREGTPKAELLLNARDLLQPPIDAVSFAAAYDLVREVLKKYCSPGSEELCKKAALATREVLVLQVCANVGALSEIGFECAMEHAFQRRLVPELRSQLH